LAISDDVRDSLQHSGCRLREQFQEESDQLMGRWGAELKDRTSKLARYTNLVKAAVDKAGMDLVFSTVTR
jgi:hypothetical protein